MDINCKKLQDKLKQPMQIKLIPIVTVCLSLLLFGDGKPYLGYADKTNSLIVQEFEESELLIVKLRGDVDFTMFAECR